MDRWSVGTRTVLLSFSMRVDGKGMGLNLPRKPTQSPMLLWGKRCPKGGSQEPDSDPALVAEKQGESSKMKVPSVGEMQWRG